MASKDFAANNAIFRSSKNANFVKNLFYEVLVPKL